MKSAFEGGDHGGRTARGPIAGNHAEIKGPNMNYPYKPPRTTRRRFLRLTERQWEWIVGAMMIATTAGFAALMPVLSHLEVLP
jgi:hypothetical protein